MLPADRYSAESFLQALTGGMSPSHGQTIIFDQEAGWRFAEPAFLSNPDEDLEEDPIPVEEVVAGDVDWSRIINTPTTLAGYGITNAYTKTEVDAFVSALQADIDFVADALDDHLADLANPHAVTKAQVGLSLVENTALSTWAGSGNITTLGTITSGSIPLSIVTGNLAYERLPTGGGTWANGGNLTLTGGNFILGPNILSTTGLEISALTGNVINLTGQDASVVIQNTLADNTATATIRPHLLWRRSRGTLATPATILSGDSIGELTSQGYGASFATASNIRTVASANWATSGGRSSEVIFEIRSANSLIAAARLASVDWSGSAITTGAIVLGGLTKPHPILGTNVWGLQAPLISTMRFTSSLGAGSTITMAKALSNTEGNYAQLITGTHVGSFVWVGADGTDVATEVGRIRCEVLNTASGTAGPNRMPGIILFQVGLGVSDDDIISRMRVHPFGVQAGGAAVDPIVSTVQNFELTGTSGTAPTPVTIRIRSTTNSGAWGTSDNWANLDFYSDDTSLGGGSGGVAARIGVRMTSAAGNTIGMYFSTTEAGTFADRWRISGAGNFLAIADNTYDIGAASSIGRPSRVYIGTGLQIGTRPDYTITNPTTRRTIDPPTITLPQLAEFAATMAQDFIDREIFQ